MSGIKATLEYKESIIRIEADKGIDAAREALARARTQLEELISQEPLFQTSIEPIEVKENAPEIAKKMASAAKRMGVGPMAAVAGAVAEEILEAMLAQGATHALVENGGDIALKTGRRTIIGIHAGDSPLSDKLCLEIPANTRLGICTSSGSVGPSISFGDADAAVAVAENAVIADAAATAIANHACGENGVEKAIEFAKTLSIKGAIVIEGDKLAAWGELPEIKRL